VRFIVLAIMLLVSHAAAAEKLRVARSEATTFAFALLDLGMAEGIFARHGLEIESFDLAGAAKAHQALVAGSVDVELGSGLELLFIARGSPAKGVAVLAGPPAGMGLMVRADGEIGDLAALKGKAIGVSSSGSLTDWLASELARRQGWGADGVTRVALGSQDAQVAGLIAKNIDAFIGGTQTGYRLEESGRGKILATFGKLVPDFITHMIVASDRAIAARPDALRHFLAAWFETVRFMQTHKDETIRVTMPITRLPPGAASGIYDEQLAMFSADGRFETKALAVTEAAVRALGPLDKLPPDDTMIATQFLPPPANMSGKEAQ